LTVFFYPQNQKRKVNHNDKTETLEQLRAEKERAETQLAQEQHKLERLENRKKYLEKGERRNAPTAFAIWAARLRALPRRSKISHAPK